MVRPLLLSLLVAGCATLPDAGDDEFDPGKADQISAKIQIVGTLAAGETSPPIAYSNPPRYRGFTVAGRAGEAISAWVRSSDGDAMGWLLDHKGVVVTRNDNASAGVTDAHLVTTLPAGGSYTLVFRERSLKGATFVVSLDPAQGAPDGGVAPSPDLGGGGGNGGGAVGPSGGSVDLLHVGLTGDTRPPACEDTAHYPTPIIDAIADQFRTRGVQFALDLGDHMYVCNGDLALAQQHMALYRQSAQRYPGTWFMTMGNHECWKGPCLAGNTSANYVAFMEALKPISPTPYYSFDVQTRHGLATFVVMADNAWDGTQQAWLEQTLTRADQQATYTIVARHHPEGDSSVTTNAQSMAVVRAHKFSLFLTGHSHLYKHMTTDGGRDLVLGTGGAPLIAGGAFYGYAILDQQPNGQLAVSVFDVNGMTPVDHWTVGPN